MVSVCDSHPDMHVAQTCIENVSTQHFWSTADEYPDLVTRLHTQARLVSNFGLPWLKDTLKASFALFVRRLSKMQIAFYLIVHSLKGILIPFGVSYIRNH